MKNKILYVSTETHKKLKKMSVELDMNLAETTEFMINLALEKKEKDK